MLTEPIKIQLNWQDPATGEQQHPVLEVPVAFGRELDQMPANLGEQSVSRVVLNSKQVSRFHALITVAGQQLIVTDRSANGTFLQKQRLHHASLPLSNGETLSIGSYQITVNILTEYDPQATEANTHTTTTLSKPSTALWSQPWVIAALGTLFVLLLGAGTWAVVTKLLENYRPQIPQTPAPTSDNQRWKTVDRV